MGAVEHMDGRKIINKSCIVFSGTKWLSKEFRILLYKKQVPDQMIHQVIH